MRRTRKRARRKTRDSVLCSNRDCRKRFPKEDKRFSSHRCPFCGQYTNPDETISSLKAKAWGLCALYVKLRDSDDGGVSAKCCTCGRRVVIGTVDCQAGHFVDGRRKDTLLHTTIIHVQCRRCNVFLGGNKDAYWPFMIKTYGAKKTIALAETSWCNGEWTKGELRREIERFHTAIEDLGYAPDFYLPQPKHGGHNNGDIQDT